jgi:hypothetical protein
MGACHIKYMYFPGKKSPEAVKSTRKTPLFARFCRNCRIPTQTSLRPLAIAAPPGLCHWLNAAL